MMPNKFHQQQYCFAGALCVLFTIAYFFAPQEKAQFLSTAAGMCLSFMLGKLTNGFSSGKDK